MAIPRLLVLVAVLLVLLLSVVPLLRADAGPARTARQRGAAAVVVAAVAAIWMLVNQPLEGPILFTVARTHGMTVADIPSVVLFVVAAWIARPRRTLPAAPPRHAAPTRSSAPAASSPVAS